MTDVAALQDMIGRTAVDSDGDKIGKIAQIYVDDSTGEPQWVTVSTGLFGNKESFAPLQGSQLTGDEVRLAVSKELVKDAPNIDADGHLEDSENEALYSHYSGHLGANDSVQPRVSGEEGVRDSGTFAHDTADHDTIDHDTTDHDMTARTNGDAAMTRSEEQLHVGTEKVEAGRARLRKYVVTENVATTVPVSHEEVRIEREPITDANRGEALSGAEITEDEHEITLHAERPVVSKETVAVEQVRLGTETVTEQHTVNEEVRKEQIDTSDAEIPAER